MMEESRTALEGLSTPMLAMFAMLAVVMLALIGLDVYAIIDIIRRPVDRITAGNKWLWVAVVLAINPGGSIIYLAVGRKPAPAQDIAPTVPAAERASDAADMLYGLREDALSAPVPPTESPDSSTVTPDDYAAESDADDAS